jgi:hypothetical protein
MNSEDCFFIQAHTPSLPINPLNYDDMTNIDNRFLFQTQAWFRLLFRSRSSNLELFHVFAFWPLFLSLKQL